MNEEKNENCQINDEMIAKVNMLIEGEKVYEDSKEKIVNIKYYYVKLFDVISRIKEMCGKIVLVEIGQDYSFKLRIEVNKDSQGDLFSTILNIKNTHGRTISEISINMESLENILSKE